MAITTKFKDFEIYTISSPNGKTRASFVPEKGGVGSSIIMPFGDTEREILFLHDNFWQKGILDLPGGFPFIFPICARIERNLIAGNYLYDGQVYNMPIHGFSAYIPWEVADTANPDAIILKLRDNAKTFAQFPFHFLLELKYQVNDGELICTQRYTNTGDKPMPYYAGFHPYFLTPPANNGKEKVMLDFQAVRRFRYNERTSDLIGEQTILPMPASIADPAINEQLCELSAEKTVTLTYPDGFKINMCAEGVEDENMFNYLQLYTQEQLPFICIEPWMSFPNAMNTVSGVRWLQPGESESGVLKLWIS